MEARWARHGSPVGSTWKPGGLDMEARWARHGSPGGLDMEAPWLEIEDRSARHRRPIGSNTTAGRLHVQDRWGRSANPAGSTRSGAPARRRSRDLPRSGGLAASPARVELQAVRGRVHGMDLPFSRLLVQTRFCASTMTAPTPSSDSTSSSPFSGPRMKTASSISSARSAVGRPDGHAARRRRRVAGARVDDVVVALAVDDVGPLVVAGRAEGVVAHRHHREVVALRARAGRGCPPATASRRASSRACRGRRPPARRTTSARRRSSTFAALSTA